MYFIVLIIYVNKYFNSRKKVFFLHIKKTILIRVQNTYLRELK